MVDMASEPTQEATKFLDGDVLGPLSIAHAEVFTRGIPW